MRKRILASGLIAWPAAMALAQQAPPAGTTAAPNSGYVTREEYNKLQAKLDSVIQEMDRQKQAQKTSQAELDQTIDEIEKDIANNHKLINDVHLGENKFVIAGVFFAILNIAAYGSGEQYTFLGYIADLIPQRMLCNVLYICTVDKDMALGHIIKPRYQVNQG
jgi:hypothetical protein